MPRKIRYSGGRRIGGGGVKRREERVGVAGVEQAVLQRKKKGGREKEREMT
jgi:hypothetical protein